MAEHHLPVSDRGLLWTGMFNDSLQQALAQAATGLQKVQWLPVLRMLGMYLAMGVREGWRLYKERVAATSPLTADTTRALFEEASTSLEGHPIPDPNVDLFPSLNAPRAPKRPLEDTAGQPESQVSQGTMAATEKASATAVGCVCVYSRHVSRLLCSELPLCDCPPPFLGDYG